MNFGAQGCLTSKYQPNYKSINTTISAIPVWKIVTIDIRTQTHLSWQSPPPSSLQAQRLQLLGQLFITKYILLNNIHMSEKCAPEDKSQLLTNVQIQMAAGKDKCRNAQDIFILSLCCVMNTIVLFLITTATNYILKFMLRRTDTYVYGQPTYACLLDTADIK